MSQNEKPGELSRKSGQSRHKVIADLHSGMVLLAPVATVLDEVASEVETPIFATPKSGKA